LVIDLHGKFVRAQVKTGRLVKGAICFRTRSVQANTQRAVTRGYEGEADLFLIYCPETARIYSVPVDQAPGRCMHLRVDPTVNRQAQGVRWARDYELPA
jgi:hypothetical protein